MHALLFVMFTIAAGMVSAQELVPYRKANLWGFSDRDGKIIIEPKYERTWFFSDGLARVKSRGLIGYVDIHGKIAIPPRYTRAGDFHMGLAEVEQNKKTFCINIEGIPDECEPADEELAYDEDDADPFVIHEDSTGGFRLVLASTGDSIPERFDRIVPVERYFFPGRNHFALVSRDNRWGAYNEQGMLVAPIAFTKVDVMDINSCKVMIDNYWGIRNTNGMMVVPAEYDSIAKVTDIQFQDDKPVRKEFFIVGKQQKFGVLDGAGAMVIPLIYDAISIPQPCNCETDFVVRQGDLYGISDTAGKRIVPLKYKYAESFNGSSFALVKDSKGREGYVRRDGLELFSD